MPEGWYDEGQTTYNHAQIQTQNVCKCLLFGVHLQDVQCLPKTRNQVICTQLPQMRKMWLQTSLY